MTRRKRYAQAMAESGEGRRERILISAVDPIDGKICTVQISHHRLMTVARRSRGQIQECAFTVPAVLQRPTAVFEGVRMDQDEDPRGVGWRCYCGIPEFAYRADGTKREAWPNQVFLVFVNAEQVAYNWRWEQADPRGLALPIDHERRFKKEAPMTAMSNDEFAAHVLKLSADGETFQPTATYDPDGDCIEFLIAPIRSMASASMI